MKTSVKPLSPLKRDKPGADYWVTVCAECKKASCWHGEDMCDNARDADIVEMRASQLDRLGIEHPDRYSRKKLMRVCGYVTEISETGPVSRLGEDVELLTGRSTPARVNVQNLERIYAKVHKDDDKRVLYEVPEDEPDRTADLYRKEHGK